MGTCANTHPGHGAHGPACSWALASKRTGSHGTRVAWGRRKSKTKKGR